MSSKDKWLKDKRLKGGLRQLLNLSRDVFTQVGKLFSTFIRWPVYQSLKPLVNEVTLSHISKIRQCELMLVKRLLPAQGRLLEIGAGTGVQASQLSALGYDVTAIEVSTQAKGQMPDVYKQHREYPIIEYDGHHLPFGDNTFNIVFSSSVLEHIHHAEAFQKEIWRVLKPDGCALHIMPNTAWRFYSTITHYVRQLATSWQDPISSPPRHGEKGSLLTEHYHFSRIAWWRFFKKMDWDVITVATNELLYTGDSIFDRRLSLTQRARLSRILGACCNVYLMRKPIVENLSTANPK